MKPRSILIFFSILCSYFLHGQQAPNNQLKVNSKFSQTSTQNLVPSRVSDTCLDKKFSIVFYIINDSLLSLPTNTALLSTYSLTTIIRILNKAFEPICVSFEHCKTVYIPHWTANTWKAYIVGNQMVSTYFTENTINVYLPQEVDMLRPDEPEHSYAYPPATGTNITRDAIVIERAFALDSNQISEFKGAALLHAFGHYFGLPHTSDEIDPSNVPTPGPVSPITSFEYVDGTNCKTHGDGFCDTEADPWPNGWIGAAGSADCAGVSAKDGKGKYYKPPYDNFMSMYSCRCKFTPEQYLFMARYMMKERKYLH